MFDHSKLRGKIREKFIVQSAFAEAILVSDATLSKKLNGIVKFTQSEIKDSIVLLDINPCDVCEYFFKEKV